MINVIPGYGPTAGAAIVKHPGVDKVAFTGEYKTAQIIMRDAASTLKRLTFELERKKPEHRFRRRRFRRRGHRPRTSKRNTHHQGQCCCAGSRLFVEEKIHDKFVDKLVAMNKSRKLGDPFDPETEQGPQVDKAQFDKIMHYIRIGENEGAPSASTGGTHGDRGYFIEPTIFDNVHDDMKIAQDEIFGPVLSILKFKDINEVLDRANNTFYGLAAAVWTRDIAKAHTLAHQIKAGTVWINCYDVFDAGAPFGGFKMSGMGRELGEKGLDAYTEFKTVTVSMQ